GEGGDMERQDHPGLFESVPELFPCRIGNARLGAVELEVGLLEAAVFGEPAQFLGRRFGSPGQHRHAEEALGLRRVGDEFGEPVVIGAVAGVAEFRVVGEDRGDRPEQRLNPDAVAIHVLEPQPQIAGPHLARIPMAAAIERGEIGRRRVRRRRLDPVPAAPHLAVADPLAAAVALLDMGRAGGVFRGQPFGPDVARQIAEIEMIVAGDKFVIGHDTLTLAYLAGASSGALAGGGSTVTWTRISARASGAPSRSTKSGSRPAATSFTA